MKHGNGPEARNRILIVDDEPSIVDSLGLLLRRYGFDVAGAKDFAGAREALSRGQFDLVLSDVYLGRGRGTGLEVLEYVRREAPDTLVIMLTGYPDLQTVETALRKGAYDYLHKPIKDFPAFARRLSDAIGERRLRIHARTLSHIMQTSIEGMGYPIIAIDRDGTVTHMNEAAMRTCGFAPSDVGLPFSDLSGRCDGVCAGHLSAALSLGRISEGRNLSCTNAAGERSLLDISAIPMLSEAGVVTGAIAVHREKVQVHETMDSPMDCFQAETGIVGRSPAIRTLKSSIEMVSNVDSTVLIRGESGVGKDLVAQAIHMFGNRKGRPMVAINCASVPEQLLEAELFGYRKGAFTGAVSDHEGRLASADGGTVFLDEVGDMPPTIQARLLRVLETRTYERLGDNGSIKADFRLIAATNRPLEALVKNKLFREDLYFRLNVIELHVPPLRERPEDIPCLVHHFLSMYAKKLDKPQLSVQGELLRHLTAYRWPGNVRELRHVLEHACVMADRPIITLESLPARMREAILAPHVGPSDPDEAERLRIGQALREARGNKVRAAQLLGMSRSTLYLKLSKHSLI